MARDTKAALGIAFYGSIVVAACSVDDRVLSVQALGCGDTGTCGGSDTSTGGRASGGKANATGGRASSQGGAQTNRGGDTAVAGSGGAGGDGSVISIACPDLDDNTVPDCDETLATNATFNLDIEGWRTETNATAIWSFINAQAGEKSGSIQVESNAPANAASGDAFVYTGVTQCLSLAGAGDHQIFAQMFSEGEAVTAYGSVVGRVFGSADCTGSPTSVIPSPNQGNTGNWFPMQTAVFKADANAKSLLVELRVGKLATRTGSVSLRFDNVMVR
ncbi:MAG TPA: hypothetical protein VG937_23020 [Polyangiaceae bacterium]|nr:hypothetical protein [Polyangiaceae bacterium]